MKNNIGLFWLKEDFRVKKNLGLSAASKNHEKVVVFYLYKKKNSKIKKHKNGGLANL